MVETENQVIEKLKKIFLMKYDGFPETLALELSIEHMLNYIWDNKTSDEEILYRKTKQWVVEMWLEEKCQIKKDKELGDIEGDIEGDEEDEEVPVKMIPETPEQTKQKTRYIS